MLASLLKLPGICGPAAASKPDRNDDAVLELVLSAVAPAAERPASASSPPALPPAAAASACSRCLSRRLVQRSTAVSLLFAFLKRARARALFWRVAAVCLSARWEQFLEIFFAFSSAACFFLSSSPAALAAPLSSAPAGDSAPAPASPASPLGPSSPPFATSAALTRRLVEH